MFAGKIENAGPLTNQKDFDVDDTYKNGTIHF